MATEMITVKMDNRFLEEVDSAVEKGHYQNRTEFIRSALRDKIETTEHREFLMKLAKLRGSAKTRTTDQEFERIREEASQTFFNMSQKQKEESMKRFMSIPGKAISNKPEKHSH